MSENNTASQPAVRMPEMTKLVLSSSPHVQASDSIQKIMLKVLLCLVPVLISSIIFFGFNAIRVVLITTAACMVFEYLCCLIAKRHSTLTDWSAAVTGVILALNLPPTAPWWMCIIGAFVAIVIAKAVFGGLGQNPFNPAAVARVALLVGFAGPMTNFVKPLQGFCSCCGTNFVTGPTPLGLAGAAKHLPNAAEQMAILGDKAHVLQYFLGNMGGSLGETSALAILIGGIGLLMFRLIPWQIPFAMLGTTFVFTWIVHNFNPALTPGPLFHLCTGGMMIGAFFMATDMVTSPVTPKGKLVFGFLIGLIACIIRIWGAYPEGVSFAIVIVNALVPLIDRFCYKRPFGWHASSAAALQMRRGEVK